MPDSDAETHVAKCFPHQRVWRVSNALRPATIAGGTLEVERGLVGALLTQQIRLKGSPRLLVAFGRCFPA